MPSADAAADGTWTDPRVLPPDVCVLRNILDRNAAELPDKVFVRFDDGSEWTYAQTA
jgi:carnitine-CoA ligase